MPSFTMSSSQAFDDLARNQGDARASRTLLAATQAFVATPMHDRRSKKQYGELVRHFFPKTGLEDRRMVARLVCDCPAVPSDVLILLCCDEESVACQVLRNSKQLDEATLTTQILQGTTKKREAIANRDDITALHASHLFSFGERSVLLSLEQHIDRLPEIAERLHDILGAESDMGEVQKGSTFMEPKDRDYDKLVAEMERDWYEHYNPQELATAEQRMLDANNTALEAAFQASDGHDNLSDLADDVTAEDIPPKRFSFSILADDEDNAAIPPLEAPVAPEMTASIQINRGDAAAETDMEADVKREPVAEASNPNAPLTARISPNIPTAEHEQADGSLANLEDRPKAGRITFEIRASNPDADKTEAPVDKMPDMAGQPEDTATSSQEDLTSSHISQEVELPAKRASKPLPKPEATAPSLREQQELGPAPAPFVPREIVNESSEADWQHALAHLSKSMDELPKKQAYVPVRSPADKGTPSQSIRTPLPGVVPVATQKEPTLTETEQGTAAEPIVQFTQMQAAPILIKAPASSEPAPAAPAAQAASADAQEERQARISIPSGPRKAEHSQKQELPEAVALNQPEADVALPEAPAKQTEDAFIKKASLPPRPEMAAPLSPLPEQDCVLVKDNAPHGATIEAFYEKASLAKPDLAFERLLRSKDESVSESKADLADAFSQKAGLVKPDISALLSDLSMIDPPLLKSGIPAALQEEERYEADAANVPPRAPVAEANNEQTKPDTEGLAKLGFMPDMIGFEDLDLVEAVPDMPSASDAMFELQKDRAAPIIELVIPDEIYFADAEISDQEAQQAQMQVIAEQMQAKRDQATHALEDAQAQSMLPIMRQEQEVDKVVDPVLLQQANEQAAKDQEQRQEAAQVHINIHHQRDSNLGEMLNEAGDLTDLPELSQHRTVQVAEFDELKSSLQHNDSDEEAIREIRVSSRSAERHNGSLDQFLTFDCDTRLAILQSLISATVPFERAERYSRWPAGRPSLSEKHSSALLMARFASDIHSVAQVMHDISGHRSEDLVKLLQDPGGEALVAYLSYIGLDESRALSMVLHAPDALSHSYDAVSKLMTLFDQMHPSASLAIVEQLLGTQSRNTDSNTARHVSEMDEGHAQAAPRLREQAHQQTADKDRQPQITFGRRSSNKT